ncbi:MAG: QcrA and Rieske domain-containing protein [Thermincolia bacterium]
MTMGDQQFPNQDGNQDSVQQPGGDEMDRRKFLTTMVGMTGGAIAMIFAVPLTGFALSPAMKKEKVEWITIGKIADFKVGEPIQVKYSFEKIDGWVQQKVSATAWVNKKSDMDVLVFSPNCTHLGCGYKWEAAKKSFYCPCHGAMFGPEGEIITGPQPRPLDRYETKIADGQLQIGKLIKSEG